MKFKRLMIVSKSNPEPMLTSVFEVTPEFKFYPAECMNPDCQYASMNYGLEYRLKSPNEIKQISCPRCKNKSLVLFIEDEKSPAPTTEASGYAIYYDQIKRDDLADVIQKIDEKKLESAKVKWYDMWAHERGEFLRAIGVNLDDDIRHYANLTFEMLPLQIIQQIKKSVPVKLYEDFTVTRKMKRAVF